LDELQRFAAPPRDLCTTLWTGAYPRIHDRQVPPARWLADYLATYVQRDVRQLLNVGDLGAFTDFVRLCAGRSAQVLNLSALGGDAGISHNTARAWLSVLEASFICFRLPAWTKSARRQVVKTPKIHFVDAGLQCALLGVRSPAELRHHPLRGAVFESWVAAEIYKSIAHAGTTPNLRHYRDSRGLEVDLIQVGGGRVTLLETKSGATLSGSFLTPLRRLGDRLREHSSVAEVSQVLVYGGEERQTRSDAAVVPWSAVHQVTSRQPAPG